MQLQKNDIVLSAKKNRNEPLMKSTTVLYISPSMGPTEKIAPLNKETFVQRLQDLTESLKSLAELEKIFKRQNK